MDIPRPENFNETYLYEGAPLAPLVPPRPFSWPLTAQTANAAAPSQS